MAVEPAVTECERLRRGQEVAPPTFRRRTAWRLSFGHATSPMERSLLCACGGLGRRDGGLAGRRRQRGRDARRRAGEPLGARVRHQDEQEGASKEEGEEASTAPSQASAEAAEQSADTVAGRLRTSGPEEPRSVRTEQRNRRGRQGS